MRLLVELSYVKTGTGLGQLAIMIAERKKRKRDAIRLALAELAQEETMREDPLTL